jgi:hypothetical protein
MNLSCLPGCIQNAPPAAQQQAIALGLCAAQSCLQNDGGSMLQIFQCLTQSCPTQLAACGGLGL